MLQTSVGYQNAWQDVIKAAYDQFEAGSATVAVDAMEILDLHVRELFHAWASAHGKPGVNVSRFLDSETGEPMYVITQLEEGR